MGSGFLTTNMIYRGFDIAVLFSLTEMSLIFGEFLAAVSFLLQLSPSYIIMGRCCSNYQDASMARSSLVSSVAAILIVGTAAIPLFAPSLLMRHVCFQHINVGESCELDE